MTNSNSLLYSNFTDRTIAWSNSFPQTVVVMICNQKSSPVRASRLLPNQSISIPPGCFIERIS